MSFPTTHWTQIARATMNGDGPGRAALARLCADYRPAVAEFLRSRGMSPPDIEDAVQDFFLALLESSLWKRADRMRGRFRSFLIGVVHHVMSSQYAKRMTLKRGAGAMVESLDALAEAGVEQAAPEENVTRSFDRAWAVQLLSNALHDTQSLYEANGTAAVFEELRGHLTGEGAPAYAESAARLDIPVATCKSHTFRLRKRFREALRARIAATVGSAQEIDSEMLYLQQVLLADGVATPAAEDE